MATFLCLLLCSRVFVEPRAADSWAAQLWLRYAGCMTHLPSGQKKAASDRIGMTTYLKSALSGMVISADELNRPKQC
jgi:hypothetical protein